MVARSSIETARPWRLHVGSAGADDPLGDFELVLKSTGAEVPGRPDVVLNADEEATGIPAIHQ